ncbi:MAG: hypothetical protein ABIK68_05030, partial [bacterium]
METESGRWYRRRRSSLVRRCRILGVVLCLGIFCPGTIFAGGVADFGTVSKSKITLNPAGAAAIDRILFDITVFQFEQTNTLSPLSNQARIGSAPAAMYFLAPDGNTYQAESIKYGSGDVTGGHVDLAYPTTFFTLGIGFDDRRENYKDGKYYHNRLSAADFSSLTVDPGLEAKYTRSTTSFLLAIPMRGFSLGVRQNQRDVVYETKNLQSARLDFWYPYVTTWPGFYSFSQEGKISGKSSYQYNDYGVMFNLSAYQPKLDVGFLVRPSVEAVMEFKPVAIGTTGSTNITLEKLPFTEPGLNLTTIALGMDAGRVMAQVILEAGDYTDADKSFQAIMQPGTSSRNRAYDIDAYLLRLTVNPFFEFAYGVRNQEIAGSLTQVTSQVIKFPIPMGDTLILTLGRQTIVVLDQNDEKVTEGTSYSVSAEMKFGAPVSGPGRSGGSITGRGLPPKT